MDFKTDSILSSESLKHLSALSKSFNKPSYIKGAYNKVHQKAHVLNQYCNKITERSKPLNVATSRSLILEKTTKKEIFQRYSIISFTSQLYPKRKLPETTIQKNNKPLIKVTVISDKTKTQNFSHFKNRKQKNTVNKLHSTLSNQDNSTQTKNVYLMVTGGKEEKFYKIKTTGSATQAVNQPKFIRHVDNSTKQVADYKQLIKSLNMDKKKDKKKKHENRGSKTSVINELLGVNQFIGQECFCPYTNKNKGEKQEEKRCYKKNRVRITGRLGLTEDDKYFLNCSAAVDDKPILTNFIQTEQSSPLIIVPDVNSQRNEASNIIMSGSYQQDAGMQTDIQRNRVCRMLSEGTQVNFTLDFNETNQTDDSRKDKTVQCNCSKKICSSTYISMYKSDKSLKKCQSPLVIISVYPQQETLETDKSNKHKDQFQRNAKARNEKTLKLDKALIKTSQTSRSPSPVKITTRHKTSEKHNEVKVFQTNSKSPRGSPKRPVTDVVNKPVQNDNLLEKSLKKPTIERKKDLQTTQKNPNPVDTFLLQTKGTNTDHQLTKKALVDSYTKMITENMKQSNTKGCDTKNKSVKSNVSHVKVNIDTENEYYDLLYRQSKLATDFSVRKTIKESKNREWRQERLRKTFKEESVDSASMENFLVIPNNQQRRQDSISQTLLYTNLKEENKEREDTLVQTNKSFLNIRDSLEFASRNEAKTQTNEGSGTNNKADFMAPIKHYKGDDCCLTNPLQRDKEIRSLLGISKTLPGTSTSITTKDSYNDEVRSLHRNMQFFTWIHPKCQQKPVKNNENSNELPQCDRCTSTERQLNTNEPVIKNASVQYDIQSTEETCLYQQFALNRKVQVFLQTAQNMKPRPIVLSRKQYSTVKKAIQTTLSKNNLGKSRNLITLSKKSCTVTVGRVRLKKREEIILHYNKEIQTEIECHIHNEALKKSRGTDPVINNEINKSEERIIDKTLLADGTRASTPLKDPHERRRNIKDCCKESTKASARRTVSSLEIRCASVAYMKHVTFSSSHVGQQNLTIQSRSRDNISKEKNSMSIHTIYKGHRKSRTPNLGTSAYSLYQEGSTDPSDKHLRYLMVPRESKPKKPFLRRLMSCLVYRSTTVSKPKIGLCPISTPPSVNSSIDSYHISTSMGAIEMSSSIYDTSASFYSNHTILPINNKMKRGFFTSVRGLLSNRRS